jgi:hypothetical protein
MKANYLEEKRKLLLDKREQLIARSNEAARKGKNTSRFSTELRKINDFLKSLERIEQEYARKEASSRRYAVSSWFLHDCFKKLTADAHEQLVFISGAEVEGVMVMDQCVEFARHRRSWGAVVADEPETRNLLIRLEQFGHRLLAHFHSHPDEGVGNTHPSGTDEDFQQRLENAGHVALMAIFSRDGYVRFVRMDGNFDLEIYGEGVESYAPNIYRLTNPR